MFIPCLFQESNVPGPGKTHLDRKKQIPLLYSTMIRKLYLKGPVESNTANAGEYTQSTKLEPSLADLKLTTSDHGSQKSLLRDKMKDKDCSCMWWLPTLNLQTFYFVNKLVLAKTFILWHMTLDFIASWCMQLPYVACLWMIQFMIWDKQFCSQFLITREMDD